MSVSVSFCLFLSNFSEMAPFYGAEDLRDDSLWSADGSCQNLFDSSNKISYLYKFFSTPLYLSIICRRNPMFKLGNRFCHRVLKSGILVLARL